MEIHLQDIVTRLIFVALALSCVFAWEWLDANRRARCLACRGKGYVYRSVRRRRQGRARLELNVCQRCGGTGRNGGARP